MVAVLTGFKIRNLLSGFFIAALMLGGVMWPSAIHSQYGTCNYSEGVFDGSDNCPEETVGGATGGSSGGELSETGQDWRYLLFAGLGLTLGISTLLAVVFIIKRRAKQA